MLTLNDGRSELWQWDTKRKMTVDAECSQVHFSNKVFGRSIDMDVVDGVAEIPDILLQTDRDLIAWAFVGTAENGYTKISKVFKVNRRNKPADYVFTPVEQMTIQQIEAIAQSVRDDADAGLFNGEPGKDGIDGKDGFSPAVAVEDITGGHRVTITDKDGENTFDVMDGKDGEAVGGGGGIIDVIELPTENIDETAFYRLLTGTFTSKQLALRGWTCRCVSSLPEVGEPATITGKEVVSYYNTSDGGLYAYVDDVLSSQVLTPVGWYTSEAIFAYIGVEYGGVIADIKDDQNDGKVYLLLTYVVYSYKDGWTSHKPIGWSDVGTFAVKFNDSRNYAGGLYSFVAGSDNQTTAEHAIAIGTGLSGGGAYTNTRGTYNKRPDDISSSSRGHYAYIVGNGISESNRSNAHTLDWNGLGWFAGGLKVGGTGQDDPEAKNIATEECVDSKAVNVTGATPGQMILVKAVDEEGKPTEWEAVDRTHYSEWEQGTLLEEITGEVDENGAFFAPYTPLAGGEEYTVVWNGVEYKCSCVEIVEGGISGFVVGNLGLMTGTGDTGEPFIISCIPSHEILQVMPLDGSATVTVSIAGLKEMVHPLPKKYYPESDFRIVTFTLAGANFVCDTRGDTIVSWLLSGKNVQARALQQDGSHQICNLCRYDTSTFTASFEYRARHPHYTAFYVLSVDGSGECTYEVEQVQNYTSN